MKKLIIISIAAVVIISGSMLLRKKEPSADIISLGSEQRIAVVHKSATCGCCANYISYLKNEGFAVTAENHIDMGLIKEQYHVPNGLESCHTAVIDGYVVEGHIPVASIAKLLSESPQVAGIALPGMPAGSPGMGGSKIDSFAVYSFSEIGGADRYDAQ